MFADTARVTNVRIIIIIIMAVGAGLYTHDVVVKSSRSLSYVLMSSCYRTARLVTDRQAHRTSLIKNKKTTRFI